MLHVQQTSSVCHVTLNRPESRNAFNAELIRRLTQAVASASNDPTVRVVHLNGAGKAFSAGADLEWMRSMASSSLTENVADAQVLGELFQVIDECAKPVVCEVHGAAMGGGVGLVAASDIVIAHPDTKFALTEVKLGLIPAVISPYVIAKTGASQARRYFLTGEIFTAHDAHRIGLVHEVTQDVASRTAAVLDMLLANGPLAVAGAKALIRHVVGQVSTETLHYTYKAIAHHRVSAEGQEGMAAFLEKRAPSWSKQ